MCFKMNTIVPKFQPVITVFEIAKCEKNIKMLLNKFVTRLMDSYRVYQPMFHICCS